jgi:hypothetical protein
VIQSFAASIPDEKLPVFNGHQVTAEELKAISDLATPYFVGLGPIDNPDMTPQQIKREARRRTRMMLPSIKRDAAKMAASPKMIDGKPVAGFLFLTAAFVATVLEYIVAWVIEELILWVIKRNWPATTEGVTAATCSILNDESGS